MKNFNKDKEIEVVFDGIAENRRKSALANCLRILQSLSNLKDMAELNLKQMKETIASLEKKAAEAYDKAASFDSEDIVADANNGDKDAILILEGSKLMCDAGNTLTNVRNTLVAIFKEDEKKIKKQISNFDKQIKRVNRDIASLTKIGNLAKDGNGLVSELCEEDAENE